MITPHRSPSVQRIFIVDDDEVAALVTQRGLQMRLGAAAEVTIMSPSGAWLRCMREPVDLLVVDPISHHSASATLIKALHEARPEILVLVLTAFDTPRLRIEMRACGVQHYFAKPGMLVDLEHAVRAALGLAATPRSC